MSLDFYLEGDETQEQCTCLFCDNIHTRTYNPKLFWKNITHNLTEMADEAGIYHALWMPNEHGFEYAHQIIPILEKGLKKLNKSYQYFTKFEASNGWGSVDGLIKFTDDVLHACKEYPQSKIRVSR
jgi:hypothetical protein